MRAANTLLADAARSHRFDDDVAVPFRCECDDEECRELVLLTLPQFTDCEEVVFTTPTHTLVGSVTVSETDGYRLSSTPTGMHRPSV